MLFESNCIFNILVLEYDSLIAIKFFEKTVFWMKTLGNMFLFSNEIE